MLYHSVYFKGESSFSLFRGGYIGVEFFGIVSGYLLAVSAQKKSACQYQKTGAETFQFIWRKIISFAPYWLFISFMNFCLKVSDIKTIGAFFKLLVNSVWGLAFLGMSGIGKESMLIGVGWYISSMLLASFVLYPLCLYNAKVYTEIVCPLFSLLIFGFFSQRYGTLSRVSQWYGVLYSGTLRMLASMTLGGVVFALSEKMKRMPFTNFERRLFSIIENTGFILILWIISFKWESTYDFLIVLIYAVCITLICSQVGSANPFFNEKWLKNAGNMSLVLYLTQSTTTNILLEWDPGIGYWKTTCLYVFMTIILSEMILLSVNKMRKTLCS
ncbi:MAG: acyltransferase [Lachnospiraceae bacterium]|nr:acyltransferase [Lachnospiraceae bacterium]